MAPRIQLLPAAFADQIAAGEVVERPSSVVKELIENAIDAGARRIDVELERGGLGKISVVDDGEGMAPEDAHLALRRHATSKLRTADELFRLSSFGFRGEALPSIASISELTLITRRADATAAYALVTRTGQLGEVRELGAPVGTRIEVRALFANVPARLKFQKSAAVESGHVLDTITRLSLASPEVHLRLRVDGRAVVELPPHPSLAERAIAVLRRSAPATKIASAVHTEGPYTVEAHVAPPDESQQSARRVHLVVNRRVVRDRGLLTAVQLGFGELLPRGRHPLAVVSISIPPEDVDVNVHPQKLEVRLARPAEVYAAVRHAVARAVAAGGFVATLEAQRHADAFYADREHEPIFVAHDAADPYEEPVERGAERGRAYELVRAMAGVDAARIEASDAVPSIAQQPDLVPRYLGRLPHGYLLFEGARGLVVVDQHAASALVLSARSERPIAHAHAPIVLPVALRAHTELLEELGFVLDPARTHALATPGSAAPASILQELAAALTEGGADEARARGFTLVAASPAQVLDDDAACVLLERLRALAADGRVGPLDAACWRGRRALVVLPLSELWRRLEA